MPSERYSRWKQKSCTNSHAELVIFANTPVMPRNEGSIFINFQSMVCYLIYGIRRPEKTTGWDVPGVSPFQPGDEWWQDHSLLALGQVGCMGGHGCLAIRFLFVDVGKTWNPKANH